MAWNNGGGGKFEQIKSSFLFVGTIVVISYSRDWTALWLLTFRHFVTGSPSPEHHPFPSTKAVGSALISSPTLKPTNLLCYHIYFW